MRQDFLDFFDAEYLLVVRFMMRMGASLPAAEDAAQHAFEKGWRKVQRKEWHRVEHPRAWTRKVALHHYRTEHRGLDEVPFDTGVDPVVPGPGHAELADEARDLIALLELLDDDCRVVFALRFDGVPGPEIAAELNLTQQRVRDLYKRARRDLRKHWEGGNEQ